MERIRPLSTQAENILLLLAKQPRKWRYGYDLCSETGIKPGSMYPILIRLAERGVLDTSWESDVPQGRPPRHMYRLSRQCLALAREIAAARRSRKSRGNRRRFTIEGAK